MGVRKFRFAQFVIDDKDAVCFSHKILSRYDWGGTTRWGYESESTYQEGTSLSGCQLLK